MTVVLTMGTFDLPHHGHVRLMQRCRDVAGRDGRVLVAVNTDEFVEKFKGVKPRLDVFARREILSAWRLIDAVLINPGGEHQKALISYVMPDEIVVGSDWAGRDYHAQLGVTKEWLDARDIRIKYVAYTDGVSSTMLRG
jgi:cytidyltransferase-like protein